MISSSDNTSLQLSLRSTIIQSNLHPTVHVTIMFLEMLCNYDDTDLPNKAWRATWVNRSRVPMNKGRIELCRQLLRRWTGTDRLAIAICM